MGWHDLRPDLATDRHAIDPQCFAQSVVGLDQYPNSVAHPILNNDARGCAGAALELVANHAGAATNVAFGDRPACSGIESRKRMFRFKWKALNVAQPSIVGLGNDREVKLLWSAVAHPDCAYRVADDADLVVFVMPIGAPRMPCSAIQGRPVISPLPLNEKAPAKTQSVRSRRHVAR